MQLHAVPSRSLARWAHHTQKVPRVQLRPVVVRAAISTAADSFKIPAAPDLIPDGPWNKVDGGVCAAKGFRATGAYAGLRASGIKADLSLVVADGEGAVAAGVTTTNRVCAAPVTVCRARLAAGRKVKAVLSNAGQANAATGKQGTEDAEACAAKCAEVLGINPEEVLIMSTGVIGRRLKMDAFLEALPQLPATLGDSAADALRCAVAITTTDLVSKSGALEVSLSGGRSVRLGGMAKGSGMIHPNMATMLALVTCDAHVEPAAWSAIVKRAADNSFNQITVDGDTSTNDTLLALASGAAGGAPVAAGSEDASALEAALTALLQGLAKSIAWDGEGATCLVEVRVTGADSDADARSVAKSVAGSSLAKSAIFGHDPNWGRIAAAAGYAGVDFDQANLSVKLGSTPLMEAGQPLPFDKIVANKYLKDTCAVHGTVVIEVGLGSGAGQGLAWGCDLSYDYVKINAEYTT